MFSESFSLSLEKAEIEPVEPTGDMSGKPKNMETQEQGKSGESRLSIYYVYIYIHVYIHIVIVQEDKINGKSRKKQVVKHMFGVISCCQRSVPREKTW